LRVYPILTPVRISGENFHIRYLALQTVVHAKNDLMIFETGFSDGSVLKRRLASIGLDTSEFTFVFNTHVHIDHFGGNHLFKNARTVLSREEYLYHEQWKNAFIAAPDKTRFIRDAFHNLSAKEIETTAEMLSVIYTKHYHENLIGERERFSFVEDSPRIPDFVRVIRTPGHTPHHLAFFLQGRERTLVVTGDSIPSKRSFFEGVFNFTELYADYRRADASADTLRELSRGCTGGMVHPGHDRPFHARENGYIPLKPYEL